VPNDKDRALMSLYFANIINGHPLRKFRETAPPLDNDRWCGRIGIEGLRTIRCAPFAGSFDKIYIEPILVSPCVCRSRVLPLGIYVPSDQFAIFHMRSRYDWQPRHICADLRPGRDGLFAHRIQLALHDGDLFTGGISLIECGIGKIAGRFVGPAQNVPLSDANPDVNGSSNKYPNGSPYYRIAKGAFLLLCCSLLSEFRIIRIYRLNEAYNDQLYETGNERWRGLIVAAALIIGWTADVYGTILLLRAT